jgi:hypothetical protein
MKRPLENVFYWLGVVFAALIGFFILCLIGMGLFARNMIELDMVNWYVVNSPRSEFGDGVDGNRHYRFVIEQRPGANCVILGAHRYQNGALADKPEHVTAYPKNCAPLPPVDSENPN